MAPKKFNIKIKPAAEIIELDNEPESIDALPLGASALRSLERRPYVLRAPNANLNFARVEPASSSDVQRPSRSSRMSTASSFVPPPGASTTLKFTSDVATAVKRMGHWFQNEAKKSKVETELLRYQVQERFSDHERRLVMLETQRCQPEVQQGCSIKPKQARTKCAYCAKDLAVGSLRGHTKRFHPQVVLVDRLKL